MLTAFSVPYMRMADFAHSTGPFKLWKGDEPQRRKFLSTALEIIESQGCVSIACAVESAAFNKRKSRLEPLFGNAYLFAARTAASMAEGYCEDRHLSLPVEYIFEAGDDRQDVLRQAMKSEGLPQPIFREKRATDNPLRSVLPLQAADFLAYELTKGYRDLGRREVRHPLTIFDRMPEKDWGIYEEENMDRLLTINSGVWAMDRAIGKEKENKS